MPSFFKTEGPSATLAGLSCEKFPRLSHFNALRQRFLLDAGQIIVHFCHPNDIAICETHEIKVRRAVIVDEERSINALLIPYRLLHLLTERALGVSAVATQICSSVE